jgi:hypothetical protein
MGGLPTPKQSAQYNNTGLDGRPPTTQVAGSQHGRAKERERLEGKYSR